jgi:hypothetical protein
MPDDSDLHGSVAPEGDPTYAPFLPVMFRAAFAAAGYSQDAVVAYAPGYYTAGGPFPMQRRHASPPLVDRPLRVIHVGQYMVRAGIEIWLRALIRLADPRHLVFQRCVVTSALSDRRVIGEMPVPVEVGGQRSVRRAAEDCDVLLVSGPQEVAGWLEGIRPRVCVVVAHGDTIWTRKILESCSPVIDHVVAVSKNVQAKVCNGFPSSVIYNGVDTAHLTRTAPRNEVRARFGFKPQDFVVGSVMRLTPGKNPEQLLEAIAKLPPRFKLLLVGWGALQQKLLHMANEIAPLRCVITAAEQDMGDYYSAMDAFCLPSESEGFGLATLEAMFCGVPVVTTRTGFPPEMLRPGVHYLSCTAEPSSIAAALKKLAQHPRWRTGLAVQGRRAAERFGFALRMCREYERLLIKLWKRRKAAAEKG